MEQLSAFCGKITSLADPSDHATFNKLAQEALDVVSHADAVADTLSAALTASDNDASRLAQWIMLDKLCKQSDAYVSCFHPKMMDLIQKAPVARNATGGGALWDTFNQVLESLKATVDAPLISLAQAKLNAQSARQSNAGPSNALIVSHQAAARSMGGFTTSSANNKRADAIKGKLQVRTRDSHVAMKMSAAYAPAMPQEIALAMPTPDADAPEGFMQALPEGYNENFLEERRKRMREVFEKDREQREAKEKERLAKAATGSGLVTDVDDFSDVKMPAELPRDQHGVKMGNYPQGVRFLRESIRQCGGALPLEVLSQKISQMAEPEAVAEFGDLRFFLKIHEPTFTITLEGEYDPEWVVRVKGDTPADEDFVNKEPGAKPSWDTYKCELCTTVITPGRNIARHRNCRRCIAMQISMGFFKGLVTSPVSEMGFAASYIIKNRWDFDDDDLLWFARAIEASGEVRRLRLAHTESFAPILKAIRCVRDRWLSERGATGFDDLKVFPEDRAYCSFFETLGRNFNRLPIPWIETGDICDMCRRFSNEVKQAFSAPPRAGDPRIRVTNEYCGMMFCTSESDSEDDPIDMEEEFSDDEAAGFEFAPPVTISETIMVAGFERDSRKLMHKLRTAPPMILQKVLKNHEDNGEMSLYDMYSKQQDVTAAKSKPHMNMGPTSAPPPGTTGGGGSASTLDGQPPAQRTRF